MPGYRWLLMVVLCLAAFSASAQEPAYEREPKLGPNTLEVVDEAGKSHVVTPEAFAKLPQQKLSVQEKDGQTAEFSGVTLGDLLASLGTPLGKEVRGPRMALVVVVEAEDRYRVAFALPELDGITIDKTILLANRKNGEELPAGEGVYRIVASGEKRPARWARMVRKIAVVSPFSNEKK